jgi:hypothetical protein
MTVQALATHNWVLKNNHHFMGKMEGVLPTCALASDPVAALAANKCHPIGTTERVPFACLALTGPAALLQWFQVAFNTAWRRTCVAGEKMGINGGEMK